MSVVAGNLSNTFRLLAFVGFAVEFGLENDIRNWLEYPIHLMVNTDLRIPTSQVIFCESPVHNVTPFYLFFRTQYNRCLLLIRRLPTKMTRFMSKSVFWKVFPGRLCIFLSITIYLFMRFWWFGEEYSHNRTWTKLRLLWWADATWSLPPLARVPLVASCASWMRINILEGRRFSRYKLYIFTQYVYFRCDFNTWTGKMFYAIPFPRF